MTVDDLEANRWIQRSRFTRAACYLIEVIGFYLASHDDRLETGHEPLEVGKL